MIREGKNAEQYFFCCSEHTKYPIKYDRSNCHIDLVQGIIYCKCNVRRKYKMYSQLDSSGAQYWKLPGLLIEHLKIHHKDEEAATLSNPLPLQQSGGASTSGQNSSDSVFPSLRV